jgi:segregation and condensation protein A
VIPDSDLRIKLPVFEGPLDLLLFLIRKNELDIYDIPIESVTKQYIQILHDMRKLDLDVAGEFFVMAATLMEIKSRMLLPRGEAAIDLTGGDEDGIDPRWELVHQLLQYKKFKEASQELDRLAVFQQGLLARHVSRLTVPVSERPLDPLDRVELWNAFNLVLRRLSEKMVIGEIRDEQITVADQMEWLITRMETKRTFTFSSLFTGQITVRLLVATFLALLELTRMGRISLSQDEAFEDINCEARDTPQKPLESSAEPDTVTA